MKVAMLLFPLLVLACAAWAMPVEPDVEALVNDVHDNDPMDPQVEEAAVPEEREPVRARRSPFQPRRGGGGGNGGFSLPQPQQPRGSVSGSVHRQKGVGTIVHAEGQGNVWKSQDGRSRVDANGQWSKVVSGPARGKPDYNAGVVFSHDF